ncbi:response regulator [Okeania hirsuta]|uniref:response regulator n=1 Tax=Okeania hirsuta TaxID=1458930 RepID=UPI0019604570|nr:response regulator [Okeania hirsuta]
MILIIDDDQAVLASLKLLLKKPGLGLCAVKKPHTALDFIRENKVDLIILDMNFSGNQRGRRAGPAQKILAFEPIYAGYFDYGLGYH